MTDILLRGMNILQRVRAMEQLSYMAAAAFGILLVFGLMNCILGYRLLRFWMMVFGFLLGAAGGLFLVYRWQTSEKLFYLAAMAGAGIVLAIVAFMVYKAGVFILGTGLGLFISVYVIHPTTSLAFFICLLIGAGLGALAMRYEREVIIVGTSLLGGVLSGFSMARLGGLSQMPYGLGLSAGCALLGMVIQFAINKPRYTREEYSEETSDPGKRRTTWEEEKYLAAEGLDDEAIEEAYIEGKLLEEDGFQDYFSGKLDFDKKEKEPQKKEKQRLAKKKRQPSLKTGPKSPSPYQKNRGFTLVELVVVLLVLGIICAFAVPSFLGYLDKGKEKQCRANRESLITYYMSDEMIKRSQGVTDFSIKNELTDHPDISCCPSTGERYTAEEKISPDGTVTIKITCDKHSSVVERELIRPAGGTSQPQGTPVTDGT